MRNILCQQECRNEMVSRTSFSTVRTKNKGVHTTNPEIIILQHSYESVVLITREHTFLTCSRETCWQRYKISSMSMEDSHPRPTGGAPRWWTETDEIPIYFHHQHSQIQLPVKFLRNELSSCHIHVVKYLLKKLVKVGMRARI